MNPAVELVNVRKDIGNTTIIHDLSLKMFPGEVYGLLGPNGAGKTTTIRMMTGLMKPTKGSVKIGGTELKSNFEKAMAKIGAVVENPEMYDYLTGYENLIHFQRMMTGTAKSRIDEVIKLVDLKASIHHKVKTYSLGMRQRLGLAQALLHEPEVLILDEPTNGLDPAGIREIRSYLKKLAHDENICVLVSSHLLSEMEKMCDRIAVIQNGKILQVSQISDFVKQEENMWYLEAEPGAEAAEIIKDFFNIEATLKGKGIQVKTERKDVPDIVRKLAEEKIAVYEIREADKNTLEEQFLSLTGGEQN